MASHSRRPHPPTASRATARAAVSLALASAASVSLLGESARGEPRPTVGEVRAKVADLYRQAEEATERYDGTRQKADAVRTAVARLQDELARKTARLNSTRDTLGTIAAAQYRSGALDPALQLALSADPASYLQQVGSLDQLGSRQTVVLTRLADERRDIAQTRAEAAGELATLTSAQTQLAAHKRTVQSKLARAGALLASLTPGERAAADGLDGYGGYGGYGGYDSFDDFSGLPAAQDGTPAADRGAHHTPMGGGPAPSARAGQAVAFAYRALGLPYVWGATGPHAYDCSGLTQAAWKAAGVSLPRTTYTQINAGARVPRSQLRPGDLVFFYSGISHVGLYIGGGRMIHAPHPGAPVRIAPVSEMPFAGATRPA